MTQMRSVSSDSGQDCELQGHAPLWDLVRVLPYVLLLLASVSGWLIVFFWLVGLYCPSPGVGLLSIPAAMFLLCIWSFHLVGKHQAGSYGPLVETQGSEMSPSSLVGSSVSKSRPDEES